MVAGDSVVHKLLPVERMRVEGLEVEVWVCLAQGPFKQGLVLQSQDRFA